MNKTPDTPTYAKHYDSLCNASGKWQFEIREYQNNLKLIVPSNIHPNPDPPEACCTAFFEYIEEQEATTDWSDTVLDELESLEFILEIEGFITLSEKFWSTSNTNQLRHELHATAR